MPRPLLRPQTAQTCGAHNFHACLRVSSKLILTNAAALWHAISPEKIFLPHALFYKEKNKISLLFLLNC